MNTAVAAPIDESQQDVLNNANPIGPRDALLRLLSGTGIEIGALHRPVNAPHLEVTYVDRYTREQLYTCYPELSGASLVETGIIDDAECLGTIPSDSQDFVIANHVIEHMRSTFEALLTWQRVLRPGGRLFMAVPDKHVTFDHEREITSIAHLVADYNRPSRERDFEAFEEFAKFVSCRFFKVKPEAEASEFARELFESDYSIHYHVWDKPAFDEMLEYMRDSVEGWTMVRVAEQPTETDEFLYVLEKG